MDRAAALVAEDDQSGRAEVADASPAEPSIPGSRMPTNLAFPAISLRSAWAGVSVGPGFATTAAAASAFAPLPSAIPATAAVPAARRNEARSCASPYTRPPPAGRDERSQSAAPRVRDRVGEPQPRSARGPARPALRIGSPTWWACGTARPTTGRRPTSVSASCRSRRRARTRLEDAGFDSATTGRAGSWAARAHHHADVSCGCTANGLRVRRSPPRPVATTVTQTWPVSRSSIVAPKMRFVSSTAPLAHDLCRLVDLEQRPGRLRRRSRAGSRGRR